MEMPVKLPEFWLHGTHPSTSGFSRWQFPPPFPIEKNHPRLQSHQHIYLTEELYWAKSTCTDAVICKAKIQEEANVLNVLDDSEGSERLRQAILKGEIGQYQTFAQDPASWAEACKSGAAMRFGSTHPHAKLTREANTHFKKWQDAQAQGRQAPESQLYLQNLTRRWIDQLATAAQQLGFDAVICREIDTRRNCAPLVLIALADGAITQPVW